MHLDVADTREEGKQNARRAQQHETRKADINMRKPSQQHRPPQNKHAATQPETSRHTKESNSQNTTDANILRLNTVATLSIGPGYVLNQYLQL